MKKSVFIALMLIFQYLSLFSQNQTDSVKWLKLESVGERFSKQQKPVLIYFYTKNCDSCRVMEKTTFSNPEVANYINILYYPVKIDAESGDSLQFFDGRKYGKSIINKPFNDLTQTLLVQPDTFPAMVLFSRKAVGQVLKGFQNRDEIFRPLIFYAEDIDQAVEYRDWLKIHEKGFPAGKTQIMTRLLVKWKTLEEAVEANKTAPKKMILNFYNYNRIACSLMRTEVFNNPAIASYLNDNFYCVNIDVYTQDTLEIFGQKYINENQPHKFHQLPIAALEGQMTFPSFIVLDENGKVLDKTRQFVAPEILETILHYYGDNSYKTTIWSDFKLKFKNSLAE
jgi:thioredoxin-related protein